MGMPAQGWVVARLRHGLSLQVALSLLCLVGACACVEYSGSRVRQHCSRRLPLSSTNCHSPSEKTCSVHQRARNLTMPPPGARPLGARCGARAVPFRRRPYSCRRLHGAPHCPLPPAGAWRVRSCVACMSALAGTRLASSWPGRPTRDGACSDRHCVTCAEEEHARRLRRPC